MKNIGISKIGTFSLLLVASIIVMVGIVPTPGLVKISANLGVEDTASLLITLPGLGVIFFSLFAKKIIEKIGFYKSLIIGLFFYGFLGAGVVFLNGYLVLIDRFFLGGATGLISVSIFGLISHFYDSKKRLKIISLQSISMELGGGLALALSGALVVISWKLPFLIYLLSWLFIFMLLMFVPNPNEEQRKSNSVQTNSFKPLINIFIGATASMFLFYTSMTTLPKFFDSFNMGEDKIGYLLSSISFIAILSAGFIPKLVDFLSQKSILSLSFLFYSLGYLTFSFSNNLIFFIIAAVFIGLGFGLSLPILSHMVIEKSKDCSLLENLSYFSISIFLGQFLVSFIDIISSNSITIFYLVSFFAFIISIIFIKSKKNEIFDKIKYDKQK